MACAADDQSALVKREAVIKHEDWSLLGKQAAGVSVAMVATGRPAIQSSCSDEMTSADRGMS